MSENVRHYLKSLADHFKKTLEFLDEWITKMENDSEVLGDSTACVILLRILIELQGTESDAVYALGSTRKEVVFRASSRTYMIQADKALEQTLEDQGLVDPQRAEQAKQILDAESQAIRDEFDSLQDAWENIYGDLKSKADQVYEHLKNAWKKLGCKDILSV